MATASFFEVAAIAMALHDYMESNMHDHESYAITIRRKPARIMQGPQPCPQRPAPGRKAR